MLRDGKHIVGKLSSYDQYGSLVLEHSSERIFAGGKYADKEMGLYFIRGENVVMLSEMSEQASREGGGGGHSGAPALVQGTWEEVRCPPARLPLYAILAHSHSLPQPPCLTRAVPPSPTVLCRSVSWRNPQPTVGPVPLVPSGRLLGG